jgi:hypothetical protein
MVTNRAMATAARLMVMATKRAMMRVARGMAMATQQPINNTKRSIPICTSNDGKKMPKLKKKGSPLIPRYVEIRDLVIHMYK